MTATASRTQPVAEHCPACGTKLGEWFGPTLVINRKGHIVRVLSGEVEVLCPHCGVTHHLIVPASLDAVHVMT
jgi:predicted RNA-binding Zn-ribbon protein involved in translation (DUF1610 family)